MITLTCSCWIWKINFNRSQFIMVFLKTTIFYFKNLNKSIIKNIQNIKKLLFTSPRWMKSHLLTNCIPKTIEITTEKTSFKVFEIGCKLKIWEQNYGNIGFWHHFEFCSHFVKIQTPKLYFLETTSNFQQICIKKIFLTKLLDGVSVEFLFRKNQSDAILVFGRHFGFFCNHFFSKQFDIFE
jgi:hypothetical protein